MSEVTGCVIAVSGTWTFKFIWNQVGYGWVTEDTNYLYEDEKLGGPTAPLSVPRAGAYLFDVTTDPRETINLLWNLPIDYERSGEEPVVSIHNEDGRRRATTKTAASAASSADREMHEAVAGRETRVSAHEGRRLKKKTSRTAQKAFRTFIFFSLL